MGIIIRAITAFHSQVFPLRAHQHEDPSNFALLAIPKSQLDFRQRILQRFNEFFKRCGVLSLSCDLYCNVECHQPMKCFFEVTWKLTMRQVVTHVSQSNTLLTTCLAILAYSMTKLWEKLPSVRSVLWRQDRLFKINKWIFVVCSVNRLDLEVWFRAAENCDLVFLSVTLLACQRAT